MGVFAIAVLALMQLITGTMGHHIALRERALAQIVAENRLVEFMTSDEALIEKSWTGEEDQAGQTWLWAVTVSRADTAVLPEDIMRIQVQVRTSDETARLVAEATAFRTAAP